MRKSIKCFLVRKSNPDPTWTTYLQKNHIPPKCRWCDNHTILHLVTTHIKLYLQSGAPILSANFFTSALSSPVNTSGCSLSCCNTPAAITETCCRISTCSKGLCKGLWSSAYEPEKHQYSGHRTSSLLQFMKCNVKKRWFDYVEKILGISFAIQNRNCARANFFFFLDISTLEDEPTMSSLSRKQLPSDMVSHPRRTEFSVVYMFHRYFSI